MGRVCFCLLIDSVVSIRDGRGFGVYARYAAFAVIEHAAGMPFDDSVSGRMLPLPHSLLRVSLRGLRPPLLAQL